ncbi:MAG: pectinesterase family protein, partial [Bacteroidota bacterium]
TVMARWKDSFSLTPGQPAKWSYDQGVILKGFESLWYTTGNVKWFNYILKCMDFYVREDGSIKGYRPDEYNIDHINNGKLLLLLHSVTNKEKYYKAATLLRNQLKTHPRTLEGGFWHKNIYPWQMWLDGLYMGQPFYAEYAATFNEPEAFNDITRQFVLMETHARDAKTGLLYHGWDEKKEQAWANEETGLSPQVWGRAMGWYGMAMVDVLDHFPANHPGKDSIIQILNRFAKAVVKYQDAKTGLWYDIIDKATTPKNYFEASASSMLVYTLAKGVRNNHLPATYLTAAKRGYAGILKQFIKVEDGQTNLHGTVSVSGLGGKPYRDGSFEYYMSEKVIVNDPKGMGAFIKAGVEMDMLSTLATAKNKTVVIDNYFNNESRKDITGRSVPFHYIWNEKDHGGFAFFGNIFNQYGAITKTLSASPTAQLLKDASVYIIVDPDTEKETPKPNGISFMHGEEIAEWVRGGGVLLLMGNDAGNTDLKGMNILSAKFGIKFNEDNINMVKNDVFEQGRIVVPANHTIFKRAKNLFVKELATLQLTAPALPILSKDGKNVIAIAKYGAGTVFAIGDPWLYNEYVDGRKLPAEYDNYLAAHDVVAFLLSRAKSQTSKVANSFSSTNSGNKQKSANENLGGTSNLSQQKKMAASKLQMASTTKIIVDPSGKGNYKSIQAALNSLADVAPQLRTIFIKNGLYAEKIYIEKHNVALVGESRAGVIIKQGIARDAWRCGHADDWGVATINVDGNDITLQNLTVINSFGFDWKEPTTIACATDTVTHSKTLMQSGHQMALRTLNGNRLRAINCHFKAFGGDTVSPWNVKDGMFYFFNCTMEGGVDFYCPRGWAWAENCHFISHSGTAAIWHDGSANEDSKTVLKNCTFAGFDGFNLGRYHRDAQFYLVDCTFPNNMADKDIYIVPTTNNIQWGRRIYYYNCNRTGGNYAWHKNNLEKAKGAPSAADISINWLFDNKWNPTNETIEKSNDVSKR